MSLDRSLKSKTGLVRARNVLTRAERLKVLTDEERWDNGKSVFGLPKVRQKKTTLGKKAKEAAPAAGAAGEAAAAAPAPEAGKGAPTPAGKGAQAKGSPAEGKGKK